MLVVVICGAQEHDVDDPAGVGPFGAEIEAVLLLVDANRLRLLQRVLGLLAGPWEPVVGLVPRPGEADHHVLAEPGSADRATRGFAVRIGNRAARQVGLLAGLDRGIARRTRPGESRDVVVFGFAGVAVRMHADRVDAAINPARGAQFLVDGFAAQFGCTRPAIHLAGRDAPIDHVDDTAHGAAAVKECRWSLQHFDLVGQDLLDADRVVRAQVADVERADAVLQHQHALAGQSANDRAACAGAEEARGHAGLRRERLAEAARDAAGQIIAGEHDGGLHEIGGPDPERAGGHDDLLEVRVLRERRRRGQHGCNGQGQATIEFH